MRGPTKRQKLEFNPDRELYLLKEEKRDETKREIQVTMEDLLLDSGFTMVPNLLIENYKKIGLEDRQLILILCLMKFARVKRRPYPSQQSIAEIMDKDERTVRRTIQELKDMGILQTFKRYMKAEGKAPRRLSNVYSLKGLINRLVQLKGC